ncbi:hypothetical protein CXG81DRAFT_25274 [Caulochytrium protostelioides]|uniref:SAM-dependent methyltransferase RsmB-F/NOP2-type catalytic core domain-containing protein n=1 Tax=Caulochytrium protostelioides TaxID=1555241 RepID=A0A4P9X9M2_9FUNG|nr:hypothetical protein CXG81DRAFT_25274 [Caulochytrium protostelioides]|eukprot:RKP02043.1 hypothetical protein CXG81DRAFT_25274 [Caulochytrium protostelioides]
MSGRSYVWDAPLTPFGKAVGPAAALSPAASRSAKPTGPAASTLTLAEAKLRERRLYMASEASVSASSLPRLASGASSAAQPTVPAQGSAATLRSASCETFKLAHPLLGSSSTSIVSAAASASPPAPRSGATTARSSLASSGDSIADDAAALLTDVPTLRQLRQAAVALAQIRAGSTTHRTSLGFMPHLNVAGRHGESHGLQLDATLDLASEATRDHILPLVYQCMQLMPCLDQLLSRTQILVYHAALLPHRDLLKVILTFYLGHDFTAAIHAAIALRIDAGATACPADAETARTIASAIWNLRVALQAAYARLRITRRAAGASPAERLQALLPIAVRERDVVSAAMRRQLRINPFLQKSAESLYTELRALGFRVTRRPAIDPDWDPEAAAAALQPAADAAAQRAEQRDPTIWIEPNGRLDVAATTLAQLMPSAPMTSQRLLLDDGALSTALCIPTAAFWKHKHVMDVRAGGGHRVALMAQLMDGTGKLLASEGRPHHIAKLTQTIQQQQLPASTDILSLPFLQIPTDHPQCQNVTFMVVEAPSTGSAVVDKLGYLMQEHEFASTSYTKSDLIRFQRQQLQWLQHAFQFPNVTHILYITRSMHREENEHVLQLMLDQLPADWGLLPLKDLDQLALPEPTRRLHIAPTDAVPLALGLSSSQPTPAKADPTAHRHGTTLASLPAGNSLPALSPQPPRAATVEDLDAVDLEDAAQYPTLTKDALGDLECLYIPPSDRGDGIFAALFTNIFPIHDAAGASDADAPEDGVAAQAAADGTPRIGADGAHDTSGAGIQRQRSAKRKIKRTRGRRPYGTPFVPRLSQALARSVARLSEPRVRRAQSDELLAVSTASLGTARGGFMPAAASSAALATGSEAAPWGNITYYMALAHGQGSAAASPSASASSQAAFNAHKGPRRHDATEKAATPWRF